MFGRGGFLGCLTPPTWPRTRRSSAWSGPDGSGAGSCICRGRPACCPCRWCHTGSSFPRSGSAQGLSSAPAEGGEHPRWYLLTYCCLKTFSVAKLFFFFVHSLAARGKEKRLRYFVCWYRISPQKAFLVEYWWTNQHPCCYRLAPLGVKKSDWSALNLTERRLVQSPSKFILKGSASFPNLFYGLFSK